VSPKDGWMPRRKEKNLAAAGTRIPQPVAIPTELSRLVIVQEYQAEFLLLSVCSGSSVLTFTLPSAAAVVTCLSVRPPVASRNDFPSPAAHMSTVSSFVNEISLF
jgi:hypothetical protein